MPGPRTSPSRRKLLPGAHASRIAAEFLVSSLLLTLVGTGTSNADSGHSTKSVVISTSETAKFGTILVSGTTLYTLKPSGTPCSATCHKYWPEVLLPKGVTRATAGKGVSASTLGTVARPNGALQVTFAGKPLYWFALDVASGQVKGNVTDEWGKWSDVVLVKPALSTTTTTKPPPTTTTAPTTTTTQPSPVTTPPTTPPTTVTTSPSGGGVGF